jgi:sulfate transporter 4
MVNYINFLNNVLDYYLEGKPIILKILGKSKEKLKFKNIFKFSKKRIIIYKNIIIYLKNFFLNFPDYEIGCSINNKDFFGFFFISNHFLEEKEEKKNQDLIEFLNDSITNLKNWSDISFRYQHQFQQKINDKKFDFEKHIKVFKSRFELFILMLKDLNFTTKSPNFPENETVFCVFEMYNKLFKQAASYIGKRFSSEIMQKIIFFYNYNEDKILEIKEIDLLKIIERQRKRFFQPFFIKPTIIEKEISSNSLYWYFYNFFPILTWFPKYNWKNYLKKDIIAGITVGVMLIAQGMAYAKLAGLSPEYGLYSSGLPLFIYPLFGTSRHLGFGPVALISLLVSQVTLSVNNAGHDYSQNEKTAFALLISFCVGITQIFMGLIKIGFIINFISHPVIAGFTTAAALVIILSQLQYLLGYTVNKSHYPFLTLYNYVNNINKFRWQPFLFGLINIFFMQLIKFINKQYKYELPGPIICVFFSIFITKIFELNRFGISIQNKIPKGFPFIKGPVFNEFSKVAPTVLTISFINFLETVAIASKIGEMQGYKIIPDQELLGSGVTNFLGSFIGAFPMAGSFSRTAVLSQAGGQTQIAGMVTGLLIILTYLFFTPVFTYLPNVTLASIILVSVVNLIDYKEAIHLLHVRFLDFFAFMISLISTFVFGVEWGILISVAVSLFFVLWFSIKPPTSILGRIPGTVIYKNLKLNYGCINTPGGILFRMDGPLFFLNSSILRGKILRKEEKYKFEHPVSIFYIILDCRGMTDIDSTGLQVLTEIGEKLNKQGVFMGFSNVNERVLNLMKAANTDRFIDSIKFFSKIHDGVEAAVRWKNYHLKRIKKNLLKNNQ